MVPQWDEVTEVIVIGSGFAGLAAAIEEATQLIKMLGERKG